MFIPGASVAVVLAQLGAAQTLPQLTWRLSSVVKPDSAAAPWIATAGTVSKGITKDLWKVYSHETVSLQCHCWSWP